MSIGYVIDHANRCRLFLKPKYDLSHWLTQLRRESTCSSIARSLSLRRGSRSDSQSLSSTAAHFRDAVDAAATRAVTSQSCRSPTERSRHQSHETMSVNRTRSATTLGSNALQARYLERRRHRAIGVGVHRLVDRCSCEQRVARHWCAAREHGVVLAHALEVFHEHERVWVVHLDVVRIDCRRQRSPVFTCQFEQVQRRDGSYNDPHLCRAGSPSSRASSQRPGRS